MATPRELREGSTEIPCAVFATDLVCQTHSRTPCLLVLSVDLLSHEVAMGRGKHAVGTWAARSVMTDT